MSLDPSHSFIRYLRRLHEAQQAAAAAPDHLDPDSSVSPVSSSITSPPQSLLSPSLGSKSPTSYMDSPISPLASIPIPPSRYPIAADTFHPHYSSSLSSSFHSESSSSMMGSPKPDSPQPDAFNPYPLYNWSYKQAHVQQPQPAAQIPPLSFYYRPHRLEEIAPRDTISLIIALFFDFVYPLTPCVHKPSFMADLHSRREERDPLFFALVMSTVASTLVQVPRSYVPMERAVVRKLAQVCPPVVLDSQIDPFIPSVDLL